MELAAARAAADLRAAKDRASVAEKAATAAAAELKAVKDSSRVRELEEEVSKAQAGTEAVKVELLGVMAQREELSSLLDAHNAQLEACMAEIRTLQEDKQAAIEEALDQAREQGEAGAIVRKETLKAAGQAVREERVRVVEVAAQKAEVEQELEDARARLQQYERGYGIQEAVREQERLRDALRRRDADIARLTRTAGAQLDAYDIAVEIGTRLAERLGMRGTEGRPLDIFKLYPELEVRESIDSAVEKLKAVNSELQRQNDALEEQRIKLLRQARVHAEQLGDKSLRYFGLTPEQLMLVNEFAENLRDGRVELPVHDRTLEIQAELNRVRSLLADKERELDALRAASASAATIGTVQPVVDAGSKQPTSITVNAPTLVLSSPPGTVPAPAPVPTPLQQPMRTVAQSSAEPMQVVASMPPGLAETLAGLADENRKLREHMQAVVASTQDRAKRAGAIRSVSKDHMPTIPSTGDGPTDDTLSILRIKLEADDVLDPEEMVQLARVIARLVNIATEVRKSGGAQQERLIQLQAEVETLQAKLVAAERVASFSKEEVARMRTETVEMERTQARELEAIRALVQQLSTVHPAPAAQEAPSVSFAPAAHAQPSVPSTVPSAEAAASPGPSTATGPPTQPPTLSTAAVAPASAPASRASTPQAQAHAVASHPPSRRASLSQSAQVALAATMHRVDAGLKKSSLAARFSSIAREAMLKAHLQERAELSQKIIATRTELAMAKRAHEEDAAVLERCQADLRSALKDLKEVSRRYQSAATQAQVSQTSVDVMTGQIADAQKQLAAAKAELETLRGRNEELQRQQLEQMNVLKKQLSATISAVEGTVSASQTAVQRAMQQQVVDNLRKQLEATSAQIATTQSQADRKASASLADRERALASQMEEKASLDRRCAQMEGELNTSKAMCDSMRAQLLEAHNLLSSAKGQVAELRKENVELEKAQLDQLRALQKQLSETNALISAGMQSNPQGVLAEASLAEKRVSETIAEAIARMEARAVADNQSLAALQSSHASTAASAAERIEALQGELGAVRTAATSEAAQLRVQVDMLRAQAAEAQRECAAAKASAAALRESQAQDSDLARALSSVREGIASATSRAAEAPPEGVPEAAAALTAALSNASALLSDVQSKVDVRASAALSQAEAERDKTVAMLAYERGEYERQVAGLKAQVAEVKAASITQTEALHTKLASVNAALVSARTELNHAQEEASRLRANLLATDRTTAEQLRGLARQVEANKAAVLALGKGPAATTSEAEDAHQQSLANTLAALQQSLSASAAKTETRVSEASTAAAVHAAAAAERDASGRVMAMLKEQLASAESRARSAQDRVERIERELGQAAHEVAHLKAQLIRAGSAPVPSSAGMSDTVATLGEDAGEPKGILGPRTAQGVSALKLLRTSDPTGAPMEPEEWAAEVTDARAALVEALEELAVREDETSRFESLVREYASKAGGLMAQQTALYRAYIGEKASWEAAMAAAKEREAEALAKADALAAKAKLLDEITVVVDGSHTASGKPMEVDSAEVLDYIHALQATTAPGLSTGEAEARREEVNRKLRDYVKSLARKLAALQVAQPMLARKYNLTKLELATSKAGQRSAELSAIDVETHLRARILYLELWKKGAESRLSRLSELAETAIPGDQHARVVASLEALQSKHAELLASEGALRVQYTELRSLPVRISSLEAQLRMLGAELDQSRSTLSVARDEAASARSALTAAIVAAGGSTGDVSDPAAALLATASRPDLIAAVTKQRAQLGELDVQVAGLSKKNALLQGRVAELEGAAQALHRRALEAEDAAQEARAAASRVESTKAQAFLAAGLNADGSVPASGTAEPPLVREWRAKVDALTEQRDALSREVHKAREIADIASDQARAVEGLVKDRELELEEMRETVRRLSSRSDDDAIIGSLQHQLLALKASYHVFLRKHEAQKSALSRSRVAMAALELAVDQRAGEVLALKEDHRVKGIALHRLLDDVRAQLRAMEASNSTLEQATSFSETVKRLSNVVDRQAGEVHAAVTARHAAEEAAEVRAQEVESLTQTIEDLKSALATSGPAAGRSSGSDARDVARRLLELNNSLRMAQLAGLRQRRELALLRDETRVAQRRLEDYEGHVRALEERLVAADNEMRRREEEHRRQLRAAIAQASADAGMTASIVSQAQQQQQQAAVGASEASRKTSSAILVPGATSEEAKIQIQHLEGALAEERRAGRELRDKARAALERIRLRGRRIAYLEAQLRNVGYDSQGLQDGYAQEDAALADIIGMPADPADLEQGEEGQGSDENRQPPPDGKPGRGPKGRGGKGSSKDTSEHMVSEVKAVYDDELKRLQKAAVATTGSLKELLAKKNSVIAEYQAKLESLKRDREIEKQAEVRERDRLLQQAHAENAETVDKLRQSLKALQQAPNATVAANAAVEQLTFRVEELERSLSDRDRRIAELEVDKRELRGQLRDAMEAYERLPLSGAHGASTPQAALPPPAPTPSMAVTVGELEGAKRKAEESERKYREDLSSRDRKLKALQASFTALKEEFVRAEEEHAAALVHAQAAAAAANARAGRSGLMASVNAAANGTPRAGAPATPAAAMVAPGTPARPKESEEGKTADEGTSRAASPARVQEDFSALRDQALRDKLGSLVEQVSRMGRDVRTLKTALADAEEEKGRMLKELSLAKASLAGQKAAMASNEGVIKLKAENASIRKELGSMRVAMAAKVAESVERAQNAEAQLSSLAGSGGYVLGSGGTEEAVRLQRQVLVLEAQVAALKSAKGEMSSSRDPSPSPLPAPGTGRVVAPPPAGASSTAGALQQTAAAVTDARNAWENDRKLRRRIEALQAKLGEKSRDVEQLRSDQEALQTALSRVKAENDAFEKRMATVTKRQQALDTAVSSALAHLEPLTELKEKMFDLQEELAAVRKSLQEAELRAKRAEAEAQGARLQAEGAEQDAEEARQRLEQLQVSNSAQDAAYVESDLRARLTEARKTIASLEGTVLNKDASLLEARMDAEAARQAESVVRARLAEIHALQAIVAHAGKDKVTGTTGTSGKQAATVSKREKELEDLSMALKRVTDNQRNEIDRLRKQLVAAGNARDSALTAAASAAAASAQASAIREMVVKEQALGSSSAVQNAELALKTAEEATELLKQLRASKAEVARLKEKLRAVEPGVPAGDGKAVMENLRKNASRAESDLKTLKARYSALERHAQSLTSEVHALREREVALVARAKSMEARLMETGNGAFVPPPVAAGPAHTVTHLNVPASTASAALAGRAGSSARRGSGTGSVALGVDAGTAAEELRAKVIVLEQENADLKNELAAFDLEFFEEIEDLKYK